MRCPYCQYGDSRVIDSRDQRENIRRRRQCLHCGQRFTTYERLAAGTLMVVKKDGRRQEYDRRKLEGGIRVACAKRPIPVETISRLVDEIEAELFRSGEAEVPSRVIGEMVMNRLRGLDEVAYIRFASVYREFKDLETMRREIETLGQARRDDKAKEAAGTQQLGLM